MRLCSLLFLLLTLSPWVHAQHSRKSTRSYHDYSRPRVHGRKARIICPTFENSQYPLHALGFRIGDPFALSYKFFPNKRIAIALDAGKAASGLYSDYFRRQFDSYASGERRPSPEAVPVYITHQVRSDLVGDVKFLLHVSGKKISEGLQAYAGVGLEWKRTVLSYDYMYVGENGAAGEDPFSSFTRTRVAMGPEVVVGIEYAYFRIPVSAFMEAEYFNDVQADPGWRRFEGGVGLRYLF